MLNKNDWAIQDIEALTEKQAAEMAESVQDIKGHQVYFVDLGGYFGFSALVFADGQHIRFADDYALHHHGLTHDELMSFYVKKNEQKSFH